MKDVKMIEKEENYSMVIDEEKEVLIPYTYVFYSNAKENMFFVINLN